MLRNLFSFVASFFLCVSFSARAADIQSLAQVFNQEFYKSYVPGQCGTNVKNFIQKAQSYGVDINGVILLEITGGGELWVYNARNSSYAPHGGIAWFHHYVAVVSNNNWTLDADDLVIDFDYGNSPRLVPMIEYMENMLLPPAVRGNISKFRSTFGFGLISFTGANASTYLAARTYPEQERSVVIKKITLKELYPFLLGF